VKLSTELLVDAGRIGEVSEGWDEVAAQARMPLMSAAHVSSWWRHLAPANAEPRIVLVRDRDDLVGVAPFYMRSRNGGMLRQYGLPGAEIGARISPLSTEGREWEVASAVSDVLASAESAPDVIELSRSPAASPWPAMLRACWPGPLQPRIAQHRLELVPGIDLAEKSFEQWLQARSSKLRAQLRRAMRSFTGAGGVARMSTAETLQRDVQALMSLHLRRMEGRGRSSFAPIADALVLALGEIGATQAADGRFRLWILELEGKTISAQWFSACGGHVTHVNGGWDPDFRHYSPALLGAMCAIEDACGRGDRYMDLGPGTQENKLRLADRTDAVVRSTVLVVNSRIASTLALTAPALISESVRDTTKRVLPPRQLNALRSLWRPGVKIPAGSDTA
jgi:CelD/BcsL family acetyltransferase involved in cellulose biosynthesis